MKSNKQRIKSVPIMTEKSEKIKAIFLDVLGIEPDELTNETTNNDVGMDSIDKVEIVMAIEREFIICIPSDREDELNCFMDYVNIVEELSKHE